MKPNIMMLSDSYKFTHARQYPPGTENVFSYFESRGGKFKETVFFGLQYFLKAYLEGSVINRYEDILSAEGFVNAHLGPGKFNKEGWTYIYDKHNGRLPVRIKAVPEGTAVPVSNVLMTIENTDSKCYWLTNFLETLLVQTWYPTTVATLSREMKKLILGNLRETGDPGLIDFKLHDFGFRGVSSVESAGIGGLAHLVNFKGTDTFAALLFAKEYYGEAMAGFSIPAAEHSTITSWGRDHEIDAYENMLNQFPEGLVAVVSDSYNIYDACRYIWGQQLKVKVLDRNGTVVIRPDSGVPEEVVPNVLDILGEEFGYEMNWKGYKVLNPKIRVIQGDGIDYDSVGKIFAAMKDRKWSGDNIAFGMGGGLLQKLDRDTQMFAFKCSSVAVNGERRNVMKSPIGAEWKRSKAGRIKLVAMSTGGEVSFKTIPEDTPYHTHMKDMMPVVFEDGEIKKEYSFDEVRKNAEL